MVCWCVGRVVSPLTRPLGWSVQMVRGAQALAACCLLPPSHVINAHTYLVVEREAVVRVLDELVDGERGVVRLHHRVRHLGVVVGAGEGGREEGSEAAHRHRQTHIDTESRQLVIVIIVVTLGEGRME